jgi:hypothetical protein
MAWPLLLLLLLQMLLAQLERLPGFDHMGC